MLKIKDKPRTKPAEDVQFTAPTTNQKNGVEMLIALNMTTRALLTGPDVNIDAKILVIKNKPYFFFNPSIISVDSDSKDLQSEPNECTIHIQYSDYMGTDTKTLEIADEDDALKNAIDRLHNGIKRQSTKKV